MTRLSVIVPCYNVERFLPRCLEGLLEQSMPRQAYEIIVVDNNSTDASAAIARRYEGVRVVHQPVQGSYAARNLGISHARGAVIATIDPDCRPAPHWLESIERALAAAPEVGIVLGRRHYARPSMPLALLAAYEAEKVAYIVERKNRELYYGYTNNMAIRRAVFDRVGPFPERMRGGDTMFVRRAVDALGCDVVRFEPRMEVTHLEIDTVRAYYAKRAIYGESNERIAQTMAFRPLHTRERWRIFARLVRARGLPLAQAALLLALLVPGALVYEWQRHATRQAQWAGAPYTPRTSPVFRDRRDTAPDVG